MNTCAAELVITAIEVKPEDAARFSRLIEEVRELAGDNLNPVWTFPQTAPVAISVGGATLIQK